MYYFYGAIPRGIVTDFALLNSHTLSQQQPALDNNKNEKLMSPLIACWKFHPILFSSLKSSPNSNNNTSKEEKSKALVRMFFYNLEQQMNAISFQLCLLETGEGMDNDEKSEVLSVKGNRFDSFYLPQLLARSVYYCIWNSSHSDRCDDELNVETSFEEISKRYGRVVDFLVRGLDHVKHTKGFDECIRRLTILIVGNQWSVEFKQAVLLIYLSCLCDRYLDNQTTTTTTTSNEYPLCIYTNELARLLSFEKLLLLGKSTVEFVPNDFYKKFNNVDFQTQQLEQILSPENDITGGDNDDELLENNIIAFTQYTYYEKYVFAPQLRQLSFPYLNQTPFGDCQELNLFEIFINNFLLNHETKKYDLSLLPEGTKLNNDILQLLLDYNLECKFVNCLSFRARYHSILQGKPEIFQYVNHNVLSEPEQDYEVDVTAFNILAYAEWLFGISLEKKAILNKFLDFDSYIKLRKSKQDHNSPISFEEIKILQQARLRFCLEKGFKKEKKQLELAFKELSSKLTTSSRTIEIKMDRSTKQNHNLIIFKYSSSASVNTTDNNNFEIIADQYGAHVATYRNCNK